MITTTFNPKEYFEKYKNKNVNKKHKDMRKGAADMNFESYASRILSLNDHDICNNRNKKKTEKKTQKRFQIKNDLMKITSITNANSQD